MAKTQQRAHRQPSSQRRKRRSEVEWRLAEAGLKQGPRRPFPQAAPWDDTRSRRLAGALQDLGPLFSSFGLYLSSRVDLLKPSDCVELASIPDAAPPMPAAEAEEAFRQELEPEALRRVAEFGPQPLESRLLFQVHPLQLDDGRMAAVKILRPQAFDWIEQDSRHLSLLEGSLGQEVPLGEAVEDFRSIVSRLDLRQEAESLQLQSDDDPLLAALQPIPELCTSRMLVSEKLEGLPLGQILGNWASDARLIEISEGHRLAAADLARYLCLAWLRRALAAASFPRHPRAENIWILSDRKIVFAGGDSQALPGPSQANLLQHLIASTKRDPLASCRHLCKELEPPAGSDEGQRPDLEHWFRQIAPFRDGGWDLHSNGDSTSEYLFAQWRLARKHGFRARRHLVPFFQGLFQVAWLARRLAPQRDSLREALDDLRVSLEMNRFNDLVSTESLTQNFDRYAAMMMELPQKLDDVLNRAAQGKSFIKVDWKESESERRRRNSWHSVAALLLVLVSVVLLHNQMDLQGEAAVWMGRVVTGLFVLIGVLLLRAASKL